MSEPLARYACVQTVSIYRLLGALLFAMIAFYPLPTWLIVGIYVSAAASDVLDGLLARKLAVSSYTGNVIDLVSDKSLTVVSLLYAAAQGIEIFPLAIIAARDLVVLGARLVVVDGSALLPTSRIFGGIMAAILWGNTVLLILSASDDASRQLSVKIYWVCATIFLGNLIWRGFVSRHRISDVIILESRSDERRRTASGSETRSKG